MKLDVNSLLQSFKAQIDGALADFVNSQSKQLSNIGEELEPVSSNLSKFILENGKRLRPIFAIAGFSATDSEITPEIIKAAASLELIHVCALIHDDLMDGSETRRGAPAIHKSFEKLHRSNMKSGNPEQYGAGAAILLGDLALVWSAKMLHESGLSPAQLSIVLPSYDILRVELMAGQFLDIEEQTAHKSSMEKSLKIARYKSGKYTIERPLHFGAALGGRLDLFQKFTDYGLPLGEAFQLRDDILGVFGKSELTGKPAGDDLLEGKRTALIAKTLELANASQALALTAVLGNRAATPEMIDKAREIISETGALSEIESLITKLTHESIQAISGLPNEELLIKLSELTTKRSS